MHFVCHCESFASFVVKRIYTEVHRGGTVLITIGITEKILLILFNDLYYPIHK